MSANVRGTNVGMDSKCRVLNKKEKNTGWTEFMDSVVV